MKLDINLDDNAFWATLWTVVSVAIVTIVLGCVSISAETSRTAIKAGLVEKQGYGTQSSFWQKP